MKNTLRLLTLSLLVAIGAACTFHGCGDEPVVADFSAGGASGFGGEGGAGGE